MKKGCTSDSSVYSLALATEVLVALDIFLLLAVSAIPVPLIWRLQMDTRRKVLVYLMFALILICVASSVGRFVYVLRLTKNWSLQDGDPIAFASLVKQTYIWTIVDTGMAVSGACLTPSTPLLRWTGNQVHGLGKRLSSRRLRSTSGTWESSSGESSPTTEGFKSGYMGNSADDVVFTKTAVNKEAYRNQTNEDV